MTPADWYRRELLAQFKPIMSDFRPYNRNGYYLSYDEYVALLVEEWERVRK